MRATALARLFLESRRATGVTPATLAAYRVHLDQYHKAHNKLDPRAISRYLADRRDQGASPGYVWTIARTLRAYARWAFAMGYLPKPVQVEMPKVPREMGRVLTAEEARRLLAVADDKERAAVLLLLDTGLRRSEACSLTWADLEGDTLTLRRGKSGRPRIVFVSPRTLRSLEAVREGPSLLGLGPHGLRSLVRRVGQRAGVQGVTCHRFRRAFATRMVRAGVPLMHVARMMGHADLTMLLHYAAVTGDDLRESHGRAGIVDGL